MLRIIVFFSILVLSINLKSQDLNSPKSLTLYEFEISNDNSNSFGYEIVDEDQDVGPKSLAILDNYAYISDVYHNQVKRIDLNSGKTTTSVNLDKSFDYFIWLNELIPFNGKIIAVTDIHKAYVLNQDLSVYKEFKIKNSSYKNIFSLSKDSVLIIYDSNQTEDLSVTYEILLIDKDWIFSFTTRTENVEKYTIRSDQDYTLSGKPYKLFDNEKKINLDGKIVKLESLFPNINYYDTKNIAFTNKFLVYYDVNPKQLVLYVYNL